MTEKKSKTPETPGPKPKPPNWAWIRRQWESGQLSNREICRQHREDGHQISHVAIGKRALRQGWSRDYTDEIRQETQARLAQDVVTRVSPEVSAGAIIDEGAKRAVTLVREHRLQLKSLRSMALILLSELKESTIENDEIVNEINEETKGDEGPQKRNRMLRAVSLPQRSRVMSDLATVFNKLVPLERQAFALDNPNPETREDRLNDLSQAERITRMMAMFQAAGTRLEDMRAPLKGKKK